MEVLGKFKADEEIASLSEKQLDFLKEKLAYQRDTLFQKTSQKIELNLDEEERSDEIDHANADMNNFQRIRFRAREGEYVKKVKDALKRLEDGEYGHCMECGGNIGFGRLSARPTATLCIQCKEESEREELFNSSYRRDGASGYFLGVSNI